MWLGPNKNIVMLFFYNYYNYLYAYAAVYPEYAKPAWGPIIDFIYRVYYVPTF